MLKLLLSYPEADLIYHTIYNYGWSGNKDRLIFDLNRNRIKLADWEVPVLLQAINNYVESFEPEDPRILADREARLTLIQKFRSTIRVLH